MYFLLVLALFGLVIFWRPFPCPLSTKKFLIPDHNFPNLKPQFFCNFLQFFCNFFWGPSDRNSPPLVEVNPENPWKAFQLGAPASCIIQELQRVVCPADCVLYSPGSTAPAGPASPCRAPPPTARRWRWPLCCRWRPPTRCSSLFTGWVTPGIQVEQSMREIERKEVGNNAFF